MRKWTATALLLLSSCASVPEVCENPVLKDRILKFREGHNGLTWRGCKGWNPEEKVMEYRVEEYPLTDELRKQFNMMNFYCFLNGKRYHICMDKPGLCYRTYKDGNIFEHGKWQEEYIDAKGGLKVLIDSGTRCFSTDVYDLE